MSDQPKNWRRHGKRYRARRRAVDILFEAEARDIDPVSIVEDRVELSSRPEPQVAPIADYTRDLVTGAATELDRIDETIERYLSEDWELDRLPAVDRAILRMSTWELLYNPDVPKGTAVVEGVELASEYSNDVASPYIHAVLDDVAEVVEQLREEIAGETAPVDTDEAQDPEPSDTDVPVADPAEDEKPVPEDTADAVATGQPETGDETPEHRED